MSSSPAISMVLYVHHIMLLLPFYREGAWRLTAMARHLTAMARHLTAMARHLTAGRAALDRKRQGT